jgi:hypothetical protein
MIIETVLGPMDTEMLEKSEVHAGNTVITTYTYRGRIVRQDTEVQVASVESKSKTGKA